MLYTVERGATTYGGEYEALMTSHPDFPVIRHERFESPFSYLLGKLSVGMFLRSKGSVCRQVSKDRAQ